MVDDALNYLRSRRGRLALTYFGIIAALTLVFSIILFGVVSSKLMRPPEPIGPGSQFRTERSRAEALLRERVDEARANLSPSLIMFNILIDILGAVVSFYLAQATISRSKIRSKRKQDLSAMRVMSSARHSRLCRQPTKSHYAKKI